MRLLFVLLLAAAALADERPVITIYQDGYAVVRESRDVTLVAGENDVTIGNLPKNVMGESFQLSGQDIDLRQFEFKGPTKANYDFEQMLAQARGKEVSFRIDSATTVRGQLLQADNPRGNVFIKLPDGAVKIFARDALRDWVFYEPKVEDEREQSEVNCVLQCKSAGNNSADISYEAAGFMWDARYRLLLNEDSTGVLEGWASVLNRSGKAYADAELVLVQGKLGRYRNLALANTLRRADLQNFGGSQVATITKQAGFKVDTEGALHMRGGRDTEAKYQVDGQSSGDASTGGYQSALIRVTTPEPGRAYSSESYLDLTLYSLPYTANLKDSTQTEVVLLDPTEIKAYQIYSFWGLDRGQKANVTLQLVNKDQKGAGLALPSAELLLYRSAKSGLEQFVGSYRLEETAEGDTARVNLGQDAEIECNSVKLNEQGSGRTRTMEFEHTLKSSKSDTVKVECGVHFRGEVTIVEASVEARTHRTDPRNNFDDLLFTMILPPNEEVTAKFAVKVKLPK